MQVYTVPVYDMIEQLFLKKGIKLGFFGRFVYRTIYVGCESPYASLHCFVLLYTTQVLAGLFRCPGPNSCLVENPLCFHTTVAVCLLAIMIAAPSMTAAYATRKRHALALSSSSSFCV